MSDVVIVGGGTAGLTAAIYIQRSALQCVVLEREVFGGRIFPSLTIDNYPSLMGISGMDYSDKLREHALSLGAILSTESVTSFEVNDHKWTVITNKNTYTSGAVIYAAGEKQRLLEVKGEQELLGRGVAYCAACDGAFYRNKDVAIVGGGDKAFDDALILSRMCKSVSLIHRRDEFRAAGTTVAAAKEKENISFHLNRNVVSINGTNRVESITIKDTHGDAEETFPVSGVFIAIGSIPETELCSEYVLRDSQGYVMSGEDCKTLQPGFFVAGDIRSKPFRQLVTAAADGAVAAKYAAEYIANVNSIYEGR